MAGKNVRTKAASAALGAGKSAPGWAGAAAAKAGEKMAAKAPAAKSAEGSSAMTAENVTAKARASVKSGEGFGDSKAFISDVAKRMGVKDVGAFKSFLLREQQAGRISLSRADLVEAMPAHKVNASLTQTNDRWGSEDYHFVRID